LLAIKLTPVFDFFLPRLCEHCGDKLTATESILCDNCFAQLKTASEELIIHEYERKFSYDKIIDGFYSAFIFTEDSPFQSLIHSLKYNGRFRIGVFIGETAAGLLKEKIRNWNADLLLPVPLFHLKKAERGYNQSFYIAKGFSKVLNIPVKNNLIKRARYTETQTKLNLEERKENMANAFAIKNAKEIKGKKIILIDDVITTGSTVTECGKILKSHGAQKVYAVSTAIAE